MVFNTYHSRLKRRMLIAILALAVVGYFTFHAFNGDHGIIAHKSYVTRVEGLKAELSDLQAQRQQIEHRIALLKPDSLDPDMLEERARETLNLAHPRDVMVIKR